MRPSTRAAQPRCTGADSTKLELQALPTNLRFQDDTELLLSVANRLLCEEDTSRNNANAFAFPPIVDFPSFQALLHAATSAVPVDHHAEASQPTRDIAPPPPADASARTQKRRERNRISCRKTRLKRKMEHASEELLARKRAEHNAFLSEFHHHLTQFGEQQQKHHCNGPGTLAKERMARQFIARSLHFQLMDPEYDASWCFDELTVETSSRRNQGSSSVSVKPSVSNYPQQVLLEQWRVIVADVENPNLEILQISAEQLTAEDDSQSLLCCQWHLAGVSKQQQLQSGGVVKATATGVTSVRFSGRSVESIDMRVAPSATEEAAAAV